MKDYMKDGIVNVLSGGTAITFTAIQSNQVFQTISLIVTILSALVMLAYNLWKWYREASKDGKITEEEIDEGFDTLQKGVEDIKKGIDEHNERKN